jgi:hypothetical protein
VQSAAASSTIAGAPQPFFVWSVWHGKQQHVLQIEVAVAQNCLSSWQLLNLFVKACMFGLAWKTESRNPALAGSFASCTGALCTGAMAVYRYD